MEKTRRVRQGGKQVEIAEEVPAKFQAWDVLDLGGGCIGVEPKDSAIEDGESGDRQASAGFVYRPGVSAKPEPSATGVAVFIKSLFEKEADDKVRESLAFLRQFPPSWGGRQYGGYYYFALFYISQGMFQVGGEIWEDYRDTVAEILIEHQNGDGSWPFPPDNRPQSRLTGDCYPTSLAVLVLSLEKQYLPTYQRQKSLFY